MFTKKSFFQTFSVLFNIMIISAFLVGAAAFPVSARAMGLAIQVNTVADNTVTDGKCSLREAIVNANENYQFYTDCTAGFSDDGIFFSDALGTATITLGSALPPVRDVAGLTIDGGNDITISGNNLYQVFAVFGIGSLTLDSLTVKNGQSAMFIPGGGAWNSGIGSILIIRKCTFLGNKAQWGGGVLNGRGRLTITDSTFSGNSATEIGGGIYNEGGTVIIQDSSFSDNVAPVGGGIMNWGNPGGTITITGTSFNRNISSDSGGGIHNAANNSVNITDASFIENSSSLGGGVYNLGTLTINSSDFIRNGAWYGGGIYNDHGMTSSITGSSFSENVADFGAGIYNFKNTLESPLSITSSGFTNNIGDGISNVDGTVIVMQSKFTGNRNGIYSHSNTGMSDFAILRVWNSSFLKNRGSGVYNDSAGTNIFISDFIGNGNSGVYNINASAVSVDRSTFQLNTAEYGGGIYNDGSDLHLHNSTLSENKASYGGGLYNKGLLNIINTTFSGNSAKGSGIFNDMSGELHLYNTILANGDWGGDCQNHQGTVDGNNNLIESSGGDACDLINGVNGNIIGSDPDLGALSGSPAYFPLNTGSLAIDTGDDVKCMEVGNQSQNGVARPQGAHCDIGSYEAPASAAIPTPQEAVVELGGKVQELVDTSALSGEDGKLLTTILDDSILAFDKGDTESGIKTLYHFTDQVSALVKAENLKPEQGQKLVNAAQDIIDSIY